MDHAAIALEEAHRIYARVGGASPEGAVRPAAFKPIGIALAITSGAFIGVSFVLKKVGLIKANEKYNEEAGEGYGYLKNAYWWAGMTLMIVGEVLNFVAYALTDAILVTPLGALAVVVTAILSAIFLKERLSMVGKVACFLCIVGSVVIVMNAPQNSAVANIQQMQKFVITPGFLSYTGVILLGSAATAIWIAPRYGKKNMLVYISICSWVGGLSVVCIGGLGAAIIAQSQGVPQFNQWFLYVLLVFIIGTLLTEIVYLNKALNLFNAAMVTPTYYVYFTSTTIITSAVLFQGFKGSATSIITVVNGFLTICAGVVLLQLSKSAKDVPDAAVFAGGLDQIQTIAEQEQPETEPKADAIRGAAAIVRRLSSARMKMEYDELRRMNEEKRREALEPVTEDGPQYEWDGIRRRKTILGSQRGRSMTSPSPFPNLPSTPHPPLGWSHFPTDEELAEPDRPASPALSSIVGTIRSRARSILVPGHPELRGPPGPSKLQSPLRPVQLTEIAVPTQKLGEDTAYYGPGQGQAYSMQDRSQARYQSQHSREGSGDSVTSTSRQGHFRNGYGPVKVPEDDDAPLPPPHSAHSAKRQFSFQNIFRRHQHQDQGGDGAQEPIRPVSRPPIASRGYTSPLVKGATEEERLGLVKGDTRNSQSVPALQRYDDEDDVSEPSVDDKALRYGPSITHSPPRQEGNEKRYTLEDPGEITSYQQRQQRQQLKERSRSNSRDKETP
ncbi:magnesium transporter NIPA-domain-containing protein, partial [Lasiosphaeria hispida]